MVEHPSPGGGEDLDVELAEAGPDRGDLADQLGRDAVAVALEVDRALASMTRSAASSAGNGEAGSERSMERVSSGC
jgi:hypothetical protein